MKLNKMREQMAQAFINSLKEDKIPWHKEWSVIGIKPVNGVSDTQYRGINAMWLSCVAEDKGYDDYRWYTFKQAQEQGFQVRKGEKGTQVEFWSLYDTETKKKITQIEAKELSENLSQEEYFNRVKPISNTYVVFNAEQIEGVPALNIEKYQLSTEELISCRDKLISNMDVGFSEGGDRAFYSPASDGIFMPDIDRFESEYAYMSTFLHEAAHASGASNRLNRDLTGVFGSTEYAKEELRAEIASAFTAQMTGIQYKSNDYMENHNAYVQNWISILENNPNELFAAIKEAENISDYLIEKGEFDVQKVKLDKEIDNGIDAEISLYVKEHQKMLSEKNVEKTPIVINAYGGPGAGKSTACMDICSELKKMGYNAEYVQEYAKELVYDKNFEMLNGASTNQFVILKEQTRRLDRLYEQADFIVTDAPVLLNTVYNDELTPEYSAAVKELYDQYTNFSFFIERDSTNFQEEGRIHNLEESIEKDGEIKRLLKENGIYYGTYKHDTIEKVVENSITAFKKINKEENKELSEIMNIKSINYAGKEIIIPEVREMSYTVEDSVYISKHKAELALEHGIPIYAKSKHEEYHGSHEDEYAIVSITSKNELERFLDVWSQYEQMAIIHPGLPEDMQLILQKYLTDLEKQERVLDKVELLKQSFVEETKENIADWQIGQISREQMTEMLSKGNTSEFELAINELGEAGLGSSEKLRLETLDSVREFSNTRIVVKNAEKSIENLPDPKVGIDEMYKYGYTYDGMLPISRERAIELQEGFTIYRLYSDNTEAAMETSRVEMDEQGYMYGIEKEAWERHLDRVKDLEKVQDIAFAEKMLNVPEDERITEWYGDYYMYESKLNISSEQIKSKYDEYSKMVEAYKKIEGVEISNFAIDEDNYVHFTAKAGDYEYDGLYCIHDPANGPDNKIVSIDYGFEDKVFEEQWDNIENFLKEYSSPQYEDIKKHEMSLFTGADAARVRMAIKGMETSKESFMKAGNIPEDIKRYAYELGSEAKEYMDAGMTEKDVIAFKTKTLDEKYKINDIKFTKNILCSVLAKTNQEYRDYMNNICVEDKSNMMLISEGLASRIIETNANLYTVENGEIKPVNSRLEFEQISSKDFYVEESHFKNIEKEMCPVVKCEFSEHPAFDEQKTYLVSEFDKIMEKNDREWVEGYKKALEKYDCVEDFYNTDVPEEQLYLGYAKVKFTVDFGEDCKVTDRQDIGDGDGGLISHFEKSDGLSQWAVFLKDGEEKEQKFDTYQKKLKAVYDYENENNIPEDLRVTTDDKCCLSKTMLDSQFEIIKNMPEHQEQSISSLKDFAQAKAPITPRRANLDLGR